MSQYKYGFPRWVLVGMTYASPGESGAGMSTSFNSPIICTTLRPPRPLRFNDFLFEESL